MTPNPELHHDQGAKCEHCGARTILSSWWGEDARRGAEFEMIYVISTCPICDSKEVSDDAS